MASKKEQPVRRGPLPAHFVFMSNDLYARSGFESGAMFRHTFPHLSSAELRDLLVEVLQTRVIPWLDHSVQTLLIPTVHNPLRAVYVEGVPVSWTAEAGQGPPLTPATVRVSIEDVLDCARKRKIAVSAGS
jgi:hypothetical protein